MLFVEDDGGEEDDLNDAAEHQDLPGAHSGIGNIDRLDHGVAGGEGDPGQHCKQGSSQSVLFLIIRFLGVVCKLND